MTKAKLLLGSVLGVALICGGVAMAQKPVDNISGKKHPNLAAAQRLSQQAWEKDRRRSGSQRVGYAGSRGKGQGTFGPGQPGTKACRRNRQQESQVTFRIFSLPD